MVSPRSPPKASRTYFRIMAILLVFTFVGMIQRFSTEGLFSVDYARTPSREDSPKEYKLGGMPTPQTDFSEFPEASKDAAILVEKKAHEPILQDILGDVMWFDGAGITKSVHLNPAMTAAKEASGDWQLRVAFKTEQAGPLVATKSGASLDTCLFIESGRVVFWANEKRVLSSSSSKTNDEDWHMAQLLFQKTTGTLNLSIDGVPEASVPWEGLQPGKRFFGTETVLGYCRDNMPIFNHTIRDIVRITITSRTYFYGAMSHVSFTSSRDSIPDPTHFLSQLRRTPTSVQTPTSLLLHDNCKAHSSGVKRYPGGNHTMVLALVGNLRTFGANLRVISDMFGCSAHQTKTRVIASLVAPEYVQHTDRAWYMEAGAAKSAVPPSAPILKTIQERDGAGVCFPFVCSIISNEELDKAIPPELRERSNTHVDCIHASHPSTPPFIHLSIHPCFHASINLTIGPHQHNSRPLDTDHDKAMYFSKLSFTKISYLRKALQNADKLHQAEYGEPLKPTDMFFVGRPDMRPERTLDGIEHVARALKSNSLRVFVSWHEVKPINVYQMHGSLEDIHSKIHFSSNEAIVASSKAQIV
mmetsp:Transcript_17999/g.36313  ORF Transcript_17999/g.36313 Transcript_17999/m.36313 type:complete len:585 (+) Transcript_17999:41-1795(+)